MPSNKTWACFECRRTARNDFKRPKCSECGTPMRDCGKRFPTPRKDNAKAWQRAEAELNRIEQDNRFCFDPEARRVARAQRIGAPKQC